MTRALLVQPEFRSASFWNYRETCELLGARYPAAPLGLCTVAALLPSSWDLRLVDRNVDPWDGALVDSADVVLTGGMMPQQGDCLEIIREARARGKTVVVGGPDPTSSPHLYGEADHLVLDEGEVTIPLFLEDFARGTARKVYRASRRADLRESPTPRFDLLRFPRYNHVGIQWGRGCPFNCEFCDITERFGKVPRLKSPEQVLGELQTLHDLGYRGHIDFVDDNFAGNRRLAKELLSRLRDWLEARGWPFEFTTEVSINVSDDPDLLGRMREAGFFAVFVGIESPDPATLLAAKKRQNMGRSIPESVRKIYGHGMFVNAGFVIGFDSERGSVARGIIDCAEDAGIPVNMAGLLYALPDTRLTRRLAAEGRIRAGFEIPPEGAGDQCTAGINFDPLRPRADILRDYLEVVETLYAPRAYFNRVLKVSLQLDSSRRRFKPGLKRRILELRGFWRAILKLGLKGSTRGPFWRALFRSLLGNPRSLRYTGSLLALYLHLGTFAKHVANRLRQAIEEEGRHPSRIAPAPHPGAEGAQPPAPAVDPARAKNEPITY